MWSYLKSLGKRLGVAALYAVAAFVVLAFAVPAALNLVTLLVGAALHRYGVPGVAAVAVGVLAFLNSSKAEALVRLVGDEVKRV